MSIRKPFCTERTDARHSAFYTVRTQMCLYIRNSPFQAAKGKRLPAAFSPLLSHRHFTAGVNEYIHKPIQPVRSTAISKGVTQ